jgi:hypothetical protein
MLVVQASLSHSKMRYSVVRKPENHLKSRVVLSPKLQMRKARKYSHPQFLWAPISELRKYCIICLQAG